MLTFCRHLNNYVPEKVIFHKCKVLFKWDSKIGCLQPVLQEVSVSFISFYLWVHSEATFLSRIPPNGNINGIQMAISFTIFYFQNSGKFLPCSLDSSPSSSTFKSHFFPNPFITSCLMTSSFLLWMSGPGMGHVHNARPLRGTGLDYLFHSAALFRDMGTMCPAYLDMKTQLLK